MKICVYDMSGGVEKLKTAKTILNNEQEVKNISIVGVLLKKFLSMSSPTPSVDPSGII